MRYSDETKLKAIGLLHAGDLSKREIAKQLDVGYSTLLKWEKEFEKHKQEGTLTKLLDVQDIIVKGVAQEVADTLIAFDPDQTEAIEGELLEVTQQIDGYQALSDKLQQVAMKLARKVSVIAEHTSDAAELELLVSSLSRLQEAFFNKNITNINVLNNNGQIQSDKVSKFKELMTK